jgi:hypothetical protein
LDSAMGVVCGTYRWDDDEVLAGPRRPESKPWPRASSVNLRHSAPPRCARRALCVASISSVASLSALSSSRSATNPAILTRGSPRNYHARGDATSQIRASTERARLAAASQDAPFSSCEPARSKSIASISAASGGVSTTALIVGDVCIRFLRHGSSERMRRPARPGTRRPRVQERPGRGPASRSIGRGTCRGRSGSLRSWGQVGR